MSKEGAEKAITISALIVFGVYFYRHLTEGTSATATASGSSTTGTTSKVGQFLGLGTPANIGQFVTAWGFTFFILSIIGSAAPGLGGSFAILVAATDLLGNGYQISHDVNTKIGTKTSAQTLASNVPSGAPPGALQ